MGNKDPTLWSKANCYALVVPLPIVQMLAALAVQHCMTLKQGDCKNAFIQSTLPLDEITIIHPPSDYPFSKPNTFWQLQKSLYGFQRAPHHWYKLISSILESLEINLKHCPNEPCCFVGTPIPDRPPLDLVLYVNNFIYFSSDPDVE